MHEDIRLLKELQDIDYWIGELERSKAFLPDMMKNLQDQMASMAADLSQKKARLQQAQIEVKELEIRIAETKELKEKYQEQMLSIKTNKEYDALVAQIEAAKTEVAKDEERCLELMNEIEQLKVLVAQLNEENTTVQSDNAGRLIDLQLQIDSVQGKMDEKEAYRDNLVRKVSKTAMATYERVRKGRGGDVVVALRRGACGECFKSQPPQKIQQIKKGTSMETCASCGRILIWEGEE
jgi:predicted  nucleic acid-binding Zn-ribbon protein